MSLLLGQAPPARPIHTAVGASPISLAPQSACSASSNLGMPAMPAWSVKNGCAPSRHYRFARNEYTPPPPGPHLRARRWAPLPCPEPHTRGFSASRKPRQHLEHTFSKATQRRSSAGVLNFFLHHTHVFWETLLEINVEKVLQWEKITIPTTTRTLSRTSSLLPLTPPPTAPPLPPPPRLEEVRSIVKRLRQEANGSRLPTPAKPLR